MRPADQAVDLPAVSRGERRESKPVSHDVLDALLELRPFGVQLDVRDALRALAEIEKEAHEPALHRKRDAQHHQDAELRPVDQRGLLRPEALRQAGEDARAPADHHGRAVIASLDQRCRAGAATAQALAAELAKRRGGHRSVLVLRRNHES